MSQSIKDQLKSLGLNGPQKKKKVEPEASDTNNKRQAKTPNIKGRDAYKKTKTTPRKKRKKARFDQLFDTSASGISSQALRDAYGSKKSTKPSKPTSASKSTTPCIEYRVPIENPWLNQHCDSETLLNGHNGITQFLDWDGGDSIDQIHVGFDFGTSAVKVMLQTSDGNFIPVKFTSNPETPFTLPSRLYVQRGVAKLKGTDKAQVYRDLKLPLLGPDRATQDTIRSAAFIALALRKMRGWLFKNYRSIYKGKFLVWELNFGVPASLHNNKETLAFFEDLFELAYFVSIQTDKEIRLSKVEKYWKSRAWSTPEAQAQRFHQLHVLPEIAAQIFGVIRSDSWDRRNHLMSVVDIGAGTVDHGVFSITGKDVDQGLHFLRTRVEQNGVVNLHRYRLNEMQKADSNADETVQRYLTELKSIADINKPIPDTWQDYIPGTRLVRGSLKPDQTFSSERYASQIMSVLRDVKANRYPNREEWKALPVLICGGGSTTAIYRKLYQKAGVSQSASSIGFKVIPMITPLKLRDSGLTDVTYKRMSLAYGLSFSRDLYPVLIQESEISDFKEVVRHQQVQMISKDDV